MNFDNADTFHLTNDVYDICDHGTNVAIHTCGQCEDEVAGWEWVDGELRQTA